MFNMFISKRLIVKSQDMKGKKWNNSQRVFFGLKFIFLELGLFEFF